MNSDQHGQAFKNEQFRRFLRAQEQYGADDPAGGIELEDESLTFAGATLTEPGANVPPTAEVCLHLTLPPDPLHLLQPTSRPVCLTSE
ncbi:MAG TPA: hypothetical protein VHD63_25555 [Ktedonobacteraceae bacterium]|nr:hypothetical protein [Ktedonobacteraceae bacterium]